VRRASIETDAGQLPPAEQDVRRAVALMQSEAQTGDFSSSTGRAYLTLARTLSAEGKGEQARAAARVAADQLQKALGSQHPDTRAAEELSQTREPPSPE